MKYRKRPVVIDAEQWTPNLPTTTNAQIQPDDPRLSVSYRRHPNMGHPGACTEHCGDFIAVIDTLEGPHTVSDGDWIVRGVKGEVYAVKPDIFEMTYEPAYQNPSKGGTE